MRDMTLAELARTRCSALCLLAADGETKSTCKCRCGGRLHARAAGERLPGTAHLRLPLAPPQAGPTFLDRAGRLVDLDQANDELEQLTTEQLEVAHA